MKTVKDGWHKVYDFEVLVENGKIIHILGYNSQGIWAKLNPYWSAGRYEYTSASLHGMTLDEFRGYVRRKTIYLL